MLDSQNPKVQGYKMISDCFKNDIGMNLKFCITGRRQKDARTYNMPKTSKVVALIVGDIGDTKDKRI